MHTRAIDPSRLTAEHFAASAARVARLRPVGRRRVLVVPADGRPEDGVLPCEPVWTPARGRRHDDSRSDVFIGALSGGTSRTAEVLEVTSWTLQSLRAGLARSMCRHCFEPAAATLEARRLLTAAARLQDGTVVRLDADGTLVAVGRFTRAERDALLAF